MKLKIYSLLLLIAMVATACDKGDDNENGKEKPVVETGTKGMRGLLTIIIEQTRKRRRLFRFLRKL